MKNLYLLTLIILCSPFWAFGQQAEGFVPPINTDRPSQGTNSPFIVPQGFVQIETGFSYARSIFDPSFLQPNVGDPLLIAYEEFPIHTFQLPNLLLKYGLTKKLEVRLGSDLLHSNWNDHSFSPEGFSGTYLNDFFVGFKYQALQFSNSKGILSLLIETNLPESGTGKHNNEPKWKPVANVISAYSFSSLYQLTAKVGLPIAGDILKYSYLNPSWALVSNFTINERISLFSEWYAESLLKVGYHKTNHRFDGGILYLLNPNLQLDFAGGLGDLKEDTVEYRYHLTVGISWRTKIF